MHEAPRCHQAGARELRQTPGPRLHAPRHHSLRRAVRLFLAALACSSSSWGVSAAAASTRPPLTCRPAWDNATTITVSCDPVWYSKHQQQTHRLAGHTRCDIGYKVASPGGACEEEGGWYSITSADHCLWAAQALRIAPNTTSSPVPTATLDSPRPQGCYTTLRKQGQVPQMHLHFSINPCNAHTIQRNPSAEHFLPYLDTRSKEYQQVCSRRPLQPGTVFCMANPGMCAGTAPFCPAIRPFQPHFLLLWGAFRSQVCPSVQMS